MVTDNEKQSPSQGLPVSKRSDALTEMAIKEEDFENKSRKYASYLPFWA
ncbi:MAG: hypothetical protein FWH22_06190 [Fibromonadales bacterium]|nr:hypothetical protein [Fibromonadales bacterium]